jgi:hypothetical protein
MYHCFFLEPCILKQNVDAHIHRDDESLLYIRKVFNQPLCAATSSLLYLYPDKAFVVGPSILRCCSICTQLLPSDAALPSSALFLLPATPVVSLPIAKPSRFFSSRAFSRSKSFCEKIPLCRRFIACTQMVQLSDTLNGLSLSQIVRRANRLTNKSHFTNVSHITRKLCKS